jgi:hypothetical protein
MSNREHPAPDYSFTGIAPGIYTSNEAANDGSKTLATGNTLSQPVEPFLINSWQECNIGA